MCARPRGPGQASATRRPCGPCACRARRRPAASAGWRRPARRRAGGGRGRARRRRRAGARPWPRRRGRWARQRPSGPRGPLSTVACTSGASRSRPRRRSWRSFGGGLQGDEEVRGDRGGGVVGGPVPSATSTARMPETARGRWAAAARARAAGDARRPPANSAPAAGTAISGCRPNASCSPSDVEAERAGAVPDERARPMAAAAARSRRPGRTGARRQRRRRPPPGRAAPHAEAGLAQCGRERRAEAPSTDDRPVGGKVVAHVGPVLPSEIPARLLREISRGVCGYAGPAPSGRGEDRAHGDPAQRREALKAVWHEARTARAARARRTRTSVVFGDGNADADLMFVGEAPGANEDREGLPFVGQAGQLLDKLLAEIGLDARARSSSRTS